MNPTVLAIAAGMSILVVCVIMIGIAFFVYRKQAPSQAQSQEQETPGKTTTKGPAASKTCEVPMGQRIAVTLKTPWVSALSEAQNIANQKQECLSAKACWDDRLLPDTKWCYEKIDKPTGPSNCNVPDAQRVPVSLKTVWNSSLPNDDNIARQKLECTAMKKCFDDQVPSDKPWCFY